MKAKKILLISHSCQTANEGQQRAQALGSIPDIDLTVLTPDRWNEYGQWRTPEVPLGQSYSFEVGRVRLPWTGPAQWYLHHYPKLASTLRRLKPDIIDLWEEPWGLVSAHTCWLRGRLLPATKVLVETEANINRTHPFPFSNFREYSMNSAHYAVCRQTEGVKVLRERGYHGPVEVIGNAVDDEIFRRMDGDACKRKLGLSGFVAGYVGRMVEEKGLIDILNAAKYCPEDISFLFVGSGPLQPVLEKRFAECGLAERVRFMPARAMRDLPEVINAMDVLLLVSRTTVTWKEQFGRVIIEAHACGRPVLGSSSGAIPEVIDQGGIVVPERDAAGIANALRRLKDAPRLCMELGNIGLLQVKRKYTWKRVAEQFADVYRKMHCEYACC